ncbi:MAG: TetR/AcrR family transcriptional regulator [Myxococcota bacterium]
MARTRRSREESKEETRQRLLDAGRELFAEEGLDLPSLDAICERAGYTRGAFYVHFQDREEFLVAVMEKALGDFLQMILGAAEEEGDLKGIVMRWVQALESGEVPILQGGALRFHQLLAAVTRVPVLQERFAALLQGAIAHVAATIRQDQRTGKLRRGISPVQTSTLLTAIALGLVCMVETGVPFEPHALRRDVMRLLAPDGEPER